MKIVSFFAFIFFSSVIVSQDINRVSINLKNCPGDKLTVKFQPPKLNRDTAIYQMPVCVPGSYVYKNYGRFIKKLQAYDVNGEKLKVTVNKKLNQFIIINSKNLSHIVYQLDDTYDDKNKKDVIFNSGGTNFDVGKNFLLNFPGVVGYFEGFQNLPFEINIEKPPVFYGATALKTEKINAETEKLLADSYFNLSDNPAMYCRPDTCTTKIGDTEIILSVYSETGFVKSKEIMAIMMPVLKSLEKFFGKLPVEKYVFIMFFADITHKEILNKGGGALEHKNSSVYFIPETPLNNTFITEIENITSHEFLHILTPLTVHSEQIEQFNFSKPEMSKNLWMYEGITEYFSNWCLHMDTVKTTEEFIDDMRTKIVNTEKQFSSIIMTEMSSNVLDRSFSDFLSVYSKGALIAFLLDIRINELSNGEKNLHGIMMSLFEKYRNVPFDDEKIFDEIVSMTYPEIADFFNLYVKSNQPLPYAEYFNKIGWEYTRQKDDKLLSFGRLPIGYNTSKKHFEVGETVSTYNAFGLTKGDQIISINDTDITINNYEEVLKAIRKPKAEERVTITFKRAGAKYKSIGKPIYLDVKQLHYIEPVKTEEVSMAKLRYNVLKVQ